MRFQSLLTLVVLAGCAPAGGSVPKPNPVPIPDSLFRGPAVEPLAADTAARRPRVAVRPLPVTRAFQQAVAQGTRTAQGTPGPRYWQQRVSYRIEAELDPATARLRGRSAVRYANRSPDTLRTVLVHLYQNAFAEGVQRVRRVPVTGGVTLARVAAEGAALTENARAGAGYRVDGTLLTVTLPRALAPGDSTLLEFAWQFTVPPQGAPRTGHAQHEAYVVAQWYPQIAVYDDVRGWHDQPYWTNGEFYLEYGDFDVTLTLPVGWVVGATGELQNASDVLSPRTRERLQRALAQDSIVRVVTESELGEGGTTARSASGRLHWRFRARDVRDFAFATSRRYLWDATRVVPEAGSPIAVHALYRPEARTWREAANYMRHATAFHSRWHPYIYPQITAAEGPIGGMEYPMLVFIGAPASAQALYAVLSHEIAHEWFPMMVGSNETLYAWQDEGTVTYLEDLSVAEYFPGSQPALATQDAYLGIANTDQERPVMTPADLFGMGPQYGIAAYTKPGTLLRALRRVLGDETFERALRTYARTWLLKHPTPFDLFHTFEAVSGRDLAWFWTPWYFDTAWLDQSLRSVEVSGTRVRITVEDQGTAPMPVELVVTLRNGDVERVTLPVEPWLAGHRTQTVNLDVASPVVRVEIDPERWFPDVDRSDNQWRAN